MKKGSDILWLTESDVKSLLSMKEALGAMETAFTLYGNKQAQMPSKVYLTFPPFPGDLRAMPAYLMKPIAAAGVKIVNSNPVNPEKGLPAVAGIMVYIDPETGLPLGVFGAGALTSIRTGAAGGVAARHLARKESSVVGLVGCGRQAETQLEALRHFFKIARVLVWGKTVEESDAFCRKHKTPGLKFVSCPSVREACAADIIVTTTPAREPVVKKDWVRPGTHVNAIGADAPGKQELETALIQSARVVVDEWHQASHAGEINVPVEKSGYRQTDLAGELGEIVTGRKKGRLSPEDITVFDSTGLAIQDVAVSKLIYEKAAKQKKGKVLKLNG